MQSCFHHKSFLLDRSYSCMFKTTFISSFLAYTLFRVVRKRNVGHSLIHSPMARQWILCLVFISIYSFTSSASLTNRHLVRENIALNNVESYSESLSIRMARSFNRCGSINNVFLCSISSLSRIDQFSEDFFVLIYRISADSLSNL